MGRYEGPQVEHPFPVVCLKKVGRGSRPLASSSKLSSHQMELAVLCDESGHIKFPFSYLAHVTLLTPLSLHHSPVQRIEASRKTERP